jgi:hypothetical protein
MEKMMGAEFFECSAPKKFGIHHFFHNRLELTCGMTTRACRRWIV